MTIATQSRTAGPFECNGSTTVYPFTFKVFTTSDVAVIFRNTASGEEAKLVLNIDYTVALNANQNANPGGSITIIGPAYEAGNTLILTSELQYLQPTDLTNQGGFYPKVISDALDRLTIFVQQIRGLATRALKFPISDGNLDATLPGKDQRKGRVLAFDPTTGLPVVGPLVDGIGAGANYISETAPTTGLYNGFRWYNPAVPTTYVYYMDGDSNQWVEEASQSTDGGLRDDLGAVDSAVPIAGVPASAIATIKDKVDNLDFSYSDELRTLTINPDYNTTNPQCKASLNTAGTLEYPNRLGHSVAFGRDDAPLEVTYNVPVSFTVSAGQPYRNVFFLSKKGGFLQTFTAEELVVTGYGTGTISITPDAAKLSGSEEVTYWVVGDSDQFNDNTTQNNLQNNIGGYDNITNRQMSYNLGAHNLIDGTGDHNAIVGATYSVMYCSGSYNVILGGQNNQHGGISGYSLVGGEGNRNFGSYNFVSGAFSVNNAASKFNFSFGRTLDTKACENSAAFGRDNVLNANSSFMWGQNHFNYSSHYSSVGGYGANCRNAGGQTFAASPVTVGADQKTEVLTKKLTIASGGAWQKFNKLDDSPNLRLRASATALLTADVVVNLTGLNGLLQPVNHAVVRCTALYNASFGVISTSFTILHSAGTGGNVEVRFYQNPLGTDYVHLEIRDPVTNNSGSAIADISIVEFLRV